jgi:hypothetical protein
MSVIIHDPEFAEVVKRTRAGSDGDRYTEVWDGVTVMPALPNNEHQDLVLRLCVPFAAVVNWGHGDTVLPGANVSSRPDDWKEDYRCPDVVVTLAGGRAEDRHTHWYGGPDLVVEIESPTEDPKAKLDFYAAVGCRELLVVYRHPWAIELFRFDAGGHTSPGRVTAADTTELASTVLPLTFRLRPGKPRPVIVMTHSATGQTWTA